MKSNNNNRNPMTNEIIQAIREEIARLQPNAPKPGNMKSVDAKVAMQVHARLNKLLSFLSDLETKVADGEELNWEIEKYFADWEDDSEYGQAVMRDGACAGVDECKDIARHFYDLGCRRTAEKYDEIEYDRQRASGSSEIPKDLLDAQVEIVEKLIGENNNDGANAAHPFACEYVVELLQKAVSAGAKWQKEQYHFFNKAWTENMQAELDRNYENGKQAMKEQMMKGAVEGEITKDNRGNNVIRAGLLNNGFEFGTKVRVIIVKED